MATNGAGYFIGDGHQFSKQPALREKRWTTRRVARSIGPAARLLKHAIARSAGVIVVKTPDLHLVRDDSTATFVAGRRRVLRQRPEPVSEPMRSSGVL